MKYIVYTTQWSEGEVVAGTRDQKFPIAPDGITGTMIYADSLASLLEVHTFHLIEVFDTEAEAEKHNTALYPRIK